MATDRCAGNGRSWSLAQELREEHYDPRCLPVSSTGFPIAYNRDRGLFRRRYNHAAREVLRDFSIPEPVSGGFIAGAAISLIYVVFNIEIDFDLTTRDRLLVIFSAVGINTRLADLVAGGRTMVVLCVVSAVFVASAECHSVCPRIAPFRFVTFGRYGGHSGH